MNARFIFIPALFLFGAAFAYGQGTFVYDQQSSVEGVYGEGGASADQQPMGQSFTPSLSAVGFIRIDVIDGAFGNGGGTLLINLRSDSITGTVIGSTIPVALPSLYSATVDFFFSSAVAVTPGTIYYFQPAVQSGSSAWIIDGDNTGFTFSYSGGMEFRNGVARPSADLWFREGIVVPEPSLAWLALFGSGVLFYVRRK